MQGTNFNTGLERPGYRQGAVNPRGGSSDLPDQSGHAGEVLTTDGTTLSWTAVGGTGTVTSVAMTVPSIMGITGSPITGSGTLALTLNSQTASKFLASPVSSSAVPGFRGLDPIDIPSLATSKINSGTFDAARLGSGTADNTVWLRGDSVWATPPVGVTSVALSMPSGIFSTGGTPITSSGTLTVTLDSQTQNKVFISPVGSTGAPSFRVIDPADIPSLAFTKITGTVPITQGGTGATNANAALNALIPAQAGNSGKLLTTDGTDASWVTITPGTGTVTSVGLSLPAFITVTNSPVTTTGTLTGTLASQSPNLFFAAPDGTSGAPTFRAPVAADIPSLATSKITSGVFGTAFLGTGTADSTKFLRGDGTWQVNPLGTVTSVAMTVPSEFSLSGSPITTSGTFAITTAAQSANTVWAGPTTGVAAQPTFRVQVPADIPNLDAAKITTGTFTTTQIPSLDVAKITTGVFSDTFLPTTAINKGGTGQTTPNDAFNALVPSQTSNAGKILTTDGTNTSWTSATTTSPGGSSTYVQYNNSGAFGGISGVTSDGTKFTALTAAGSISLNASGSSNTNINTSSSTGAVNIGNSANTSGMSFITKGNFDRTQYTDTINNFNYLGRNYLKKASGTVTAGFGIADAYYADTDTNQDRIMGGTIWEWTDATDATRSSKVSLLITKNAVPAPRFTFNQDNEFGLAGTSSGILSIKAAAATSTHTLTFPDTQGSAGTYLKNDGSGGLTWDTPSGGGGGDMVLASVQTVTGAKTFGGPGAVGKFILAGSTSGTTILNAAATAGSGTVVLPTTGTLATLDGTETLTNKTLTSPTLTTPALGVATATSINGLTITSSTGTLTIANSKTATVNNSITLAGTDSTTMTFPATTATIARTDAAQTFTGSQTFSSTIVGSINGNAATVTNATLTTALTVNTGTLTLTANAANSSVLTVGAGAVSVSGANTGDQTTVTGNAGTATALQNARTIGGVSFDGTANITVASATGGFTVSGGDLALSTNSLTLTGSIGATGARATKGWFADLEVTNAIAGSVTGNAATATALANARTIGGTSFNGTSDITVATATGGFTVSGGNLVLGTNSLTMTGSLAATGARATKGWFTDIESTNAPTVGGSPVYYTGGTDVAFADGGTGLSSWTQYLIPYAATTTSIGQIAIGTSGQVLTSNGAGAAPTFQNASGGSGGVGSSICIDKTADETVTSSTTLQNDNEISFSIGASETWKGHMMLKLTANASAGFKFDFTLPSGATGNMTGVGGSAFGFSRRSVTGGYGNTTTFTNNTVYLLSFTIINSTTAGTVQMRFAQNASDAAATTVMAGTLLQATRTA